MQAHTWALTDAPRGGHQAVSQGVPPPTPPAPPTHPELWITWTRFLYPLKHVVPSAVCPGQPQGPFPRLNSTHPLGLLLDSPLRTQPSPLNLDCVSSHNTVFPHSHCRYHTMLFSLLVGVSAKMRQPEPHLFVSGHSTNTWPVGRSQHICAEGLTGDTLLA